MSDLPMQPQTADTELARRLEAYAAARLSPDAAASARMRSTVVAAAAARLSLPAVAGSGAQPTSIFTRRRASSASRRPLVRHRRFAVGLLAASLALVGVAGGALAANPGGPLYDARLWVERVTMPTDHAARATAQLERLDRRLGEVVHAAGDKNQAAVAAALAAYRETLDEAVTETEANDRTEPLESELVRHRDALKALLATAPGEDRDAIENAIDKSDKASEKINRPVATPKPTPKPRPTPTSAPAAKPTPVGKPGGGGQGGGDHGGGNGGDGSGRGGEGDGGTRGG